MMATDPAPERTALWARSTHRLADVRLTRDCPLARALDTLTAEAAALAGPGHWETGQLGSAHFTVRALEPRREVIPPDDAVLARYYSALRRATLGTTWPLPFRITGLTLTPGSPSRARCPATSALLAPEGVPLPADKFPTAQAAR